MTTVLQNLKESNEFLNLLLDNINSAVLIADENLQIHQFNDSFLNLFDKAADFNFKKAFGEVTGCVNAIMENKPCGESSHCADCLLRRSLIDNLIEDAPVNKKSLNRLFYVNGQPVLKHLQFSTRPLMFRGQKMYLVIIYDVTDIEEQKIELQKKQELIDQDLKSAAAIQQSLLPANSPTIENVRVAWKFEPCDQIGGDIFNINSVDERNVSLYMLDVCGHGVPAALISVAVSQFLNSGEGLLGSNCEISSPEIVLDRLERAFPFERFDSYFSIICMTLDVREGLLTYSCAGHPPPIIVRFNGTLDFLDQRGPIVGLGTQKPFGQQTVPLYGGDKVLLYTDGLLESRSPAGEYFGKSRFYDILRNHHQEKVQSIVDITYEKIKEFRRQAAPVDDISLLGVEYQGDSGNHYSI
jgi:sigma-B regulation protein RsbU (phosphoserine phosphatase)